MPSVYVPRRGRKVSRKPLIVQRSLLPKHQLQTRQIMALAMLQGTQLGQTASFMPVIAPDQSNVAEQRTVVAATHLFGADTPVTNTSVSTPLMSTPLMSTPLMSTNQSHPVSNQHLLGNKLKKKNYQKVSSINVYHDITFLCHS